MEGCSDQSVAWDYHTVCNNSICAVGTVTELGKSREAGADREGTENEREGMELHLEIDGKTQRR